MTASHMILLIGWQGAARDQARLALLSPPGWGAARPRAAGGGSAGPAYLLSRSRSSSEQGPRPRERLNYGGPTLPLGPEPGAGPRAQGSRHTRRPREIAGAVGEGSEGATPCTETVGRQKTRLRGSIASHQSSLPNAAKGYPHPPHHSLARTPRVFFFCLAGPDAEILQNLAGPCPAPT